MSVAVALLAVALFIAAVQGLGLLPAAARAARSLRATLAVLRDPAQDDRSREVAARKGAALLLRASASLLTRSAIAGALAALPLLLADVAGLVEATAVADVLLRWELLALGLLLLVPVLLARRGRRCETR